MIVGFHYGANEIFKCVNETAKWPSDFELVTEISKRGLSRAK